MILFRTSVERLNTASQFADKTAINARLEVVWTNFNNLVQSASNLEMAEKEDFENAADSLPEDVSVPGALKSLAEPIQQVVETSENLKTGLECKYLPSRKPPEIGWKGSNLN